jgi:outer membrane protein assembly factor BamA
MNHESSQMRRRGRFVVISVSAALLCALVAAHTPPFRAAVLRRLVQSISTSYGIELRAEALSYNLLTLSAELRGVQLAATATPAEPFAAADALGLSFGARSLLGNIRVRRLSIASPRIDIRRRADGADNLPRPSGSRTKSSLPLPPIRVDSLDVAFRQPSASASIRGAVLRLTSPEPGRLSAALEASHGATMTVAGRTIALGAIAVTADVEGGRLDIRELTVSRPGGTLHASGSIALRDGTKTVDVSVSGSSELASWRTETDEDAGPVGPLGRVAVTARVTGPLSEPSVLFEASTGPLLWSTLRADFVRARGRYRAGELSLDTATLGGIAGGTIEAHGTIVPGDVSRSSRIEARWAGIDVRDLPGGDRLSGILSGNGAAAVEWRADASSSFRRFEVTATTGVIASGTTVPMVVHGSGRAGRWSVKASSRDASAVAVIATADIGVDSKRWQSSTIDGRIVLRSADLPAAIRLAQALGVPAGLDAATAAGAVELDAAITGALGAMRSTGRVTGRAMTLAGLPRLDLDASFAVDLDRGVSTGTFGMVAPDLESARFLSHDDVVFGGSLVAAGTWSGPFADPVIDATFTGRHLTAARGGPRSLAATGGVFDGTVKGPLTQIDGGGTVAIGAVQVGDRNTGAITADLTLSGSTLRVNVHGLERKARIEGSIGLGAPYRFEGHGTLTAFEIGGLLGIAGTEALDPDAVRGKVSSSVSFSGALKDLAATTLAVDIGPIEATAFEVPITASRGLRAQMRDRAIHLDDSELTIGSLAARVGGTLATDLSAGTLAVDLDGDLGPLTPWLIRLSGSDRLMAAGRIAGHLEAGVSSGGLVARGRVDTVLTTLSKGERLLAEEVRAGLVFTGERVELRDATGRVPGGRLAAAGEAPLTWLNAWLPSRVHFVEPTMGRPAALAATAAFDLPAVFGLMGRTPPDNVGGRFELTAKLTALRPDPADVSGELELAHAEVRAGDLTYAPSDPIRFRLSRGALHVESFDLRGPGSRVVGTGSIGFGVVDGAGTNLRLDADADLRILGALLSGRATGRLAGHVELVDRDGALRLTSDATLSAATWLIPGQRILLEGWSGQIRLADQALAVTDLGGTVNGGSVRVNGRLPFSADARDGSLTIVARDILVDVPRGLHSQLGADLVWRAEQGGSLDGRVEITANRYTEPVTRILQLVQSLSSATRKSGKSTLPSRLADTALNIGLVVTDPILIDNSVSTVELMPDLRLGGTIASPALSGRIEVVDDGRITIGGRAYRLRDSQLRFAPADGLVPTLDASGDTRIGDYDVTIRINGTPDRVETSFSSVPPLGERELQSLIVTGQTGEESTLGRQSDDNFAAAAAATDILGFAGRFVGLDTVRLGTPDLDLVSRDVSTSQHLTVSKSLGSSFDLIFSDNLEDGTVTWVLVWKPTAVNEVRAFSVEDGSRGLEFRRTLGFGPGTEARRSTRRLGAPEQPRPTIAAVRITGAPGFAVEELSREFELDVGNRFDVRRWIDDRHRLERFYLDRGYHRVRIASGRSESADRSEVSLTYVVDRGPQTVIEVTGDPLPGDVIDAMYRVWRGLPIADVVRTEFDRIAREGLARRGYYRPVLQLDFSVETSDLARVGIHLDRGPRTRRVRIAWEGNRSIANDELDALAAPHYDQSDVWVDAHSIVWQVQQLYASRGYLQAGVSAGEPVFDGTSATLPLRIDEGVLSRLAAVRLDGVDGSRTTAATEALGLTMGDAVAASAPADAARRLKAFYVGLGYRRAAVAHTLSTAEDGSVSIVWTVTEGPLHVVESVNVVGAEATSDGLVRDAITLKPGEPMRQGAIDTTRRNLYEIGPFRRVEFDFGDSAIQPAVGDELPVTLTINAEELQRFQLKYGVQFILDRSTGRGGGTAMGVSVELRDRNFLGRAFQASVGAHWDPDLQIAGLLLSSPRLFGKRVRTNVYARDRREQDTAESASVPEGGTIDDHRRELTVEQRWRPAPSWELVWGYKIASRRFVIDGQFDVGGLLAGPVVSVIVDRRDTPFDATRGLFHSSSLQFGVPSLGSDFGYVRYLLRQSYYQPLGPLTAAGSLRFGTIQGYAGVAPVSIVDLFFNAGGTNSVRGYPEDSLSAVDVAGFTLGGPDLLVLNGELRFPITKRFGAAAFVDAGNTFARIADLTPRRLALGAGLGIRIRTPLAPFRLDVAYPLSAEYGRHSIRVHFSIGQMF